MFLINPSYEILTEIDKDKILKNIERIGRTCYNSSDRITEDSASRFVKMLVDKNHGAMLEHESLSVKFITNRSVMAELTRHRIASFAVQSQRYVSSIDTKDFLLEKEEDIIEAYLNGFTIKRLTELSFGKRTRNEINKILTQKQIPKRNNNNSGPVIHNFFEKIDTPEKAYLLGIIQADGNISRSNLTITQHEKNYWYLLKMFQIFISPTTRVYKDRNCKRISIYSKQIISDLNNKGIIQNKTYAQNKEHIDLLWGAIPDYLKATFIHGFLDGDGSIRFFQQENKGKTVSCNINWVGNKYLLEYISTWIYQKYKYKMNIFPDPTSKIVYRGSITKPDIGIKLCTDMLEYFQFPFGHPEKTTRILEVLKKQYSFASWGDKKFKIIIPEWINIFSDGSLWVWLESCEKSEKTYKELRYYGWKPEQARDILPNATATEIVITANLREWRNIFTLRTAPDAFSQMRQIMIPLLEELKIKLPEIFGDINYEKT